MQIRSNFMLSHIILFLILYLDSLFCEISVFNDSNYPTIKSSFQNNGFDSQNNEVISCNKLNTEDIEASNVACAVKKIQSFQVLTDQERKTIQNLFLFNGSAKNFQENEANINAHKLTYDLVFAFNRGLPKWKIYRARYLTLAERLYSQGFQLAVKANLNKKNISSIAKIKETELKSTQNDLQKAVKESILNAKSNLQKQEDNVLIEEFNTDKEVLKNELRDLNAIKNKKIIKKQSLDPVSNILHQIKNEIVTSSPDKADLENLIIPIPPSTNETKLKDNSENNIELMEEIREEKGSSKKKSKLSYFSIPDVPDFSNSKQNAKKFKNKNSLPPGAQEELEEFLLRKNNIPFNHTNKNNNRYSKKSIRNSRGTELPDPKESSFYSFKPISVKNSLLNQDLEKSLLKNKAININLEDKLEEDVLSSLLKDLFLTKGQYQDSSPMELETERKISNQLREKLSLFPRTAPQILEFESRNETAENMLNSNYDELIKSELF